MRTRPFAVISCDLDTVDRHLQGYGIEDLPPCDVIYRTAVPRLLELLSECGLPCVFFTIARDAHDQRTLLREMVAAGHEIASHSMTHPQPFSSLAENALNLEVAGSKAALSEASGSEIAGFRAPAWDINDRVLKQIAGAGYSYDASVFPTPALIASRLSAYHRSEGMGSIFSMDLFAHAFSKRTPYKLTGAGSGLTEFPVAVTRWLRFPTYHTLAYLTPKPVFMRALRSVLKRNEPLGYELHAADLLALSDEGVDQRMDRHPGMKLPLEDKTALLREIFTQIAAARDATTYRAAVDRAA